MLPQFVISCQGPRSYSSVKCYVGVKISTERAAHGKQLQNKPKKEEAMNQVTAHNKRYTTNEGDLYCDFELGVGSVGHN